MHWRPHACMGESPARFSTVSLPLLGFFIIPRCVPYAHVPIPRARRVGGVGVHPRVFIFTLFKMLMLSAPASAVLVGEPAEGATGRAETARSLRSGHRVARKLGSAKDIPAPVGEHQRGVAVCSITCLVPASLR
jgi:hypothetical protein